MDLVVMVVTVTLVTLTTVVTVVTANLVSQLLSIHVPGLASQCL